MEEEKKYFRYPILFMCCFILIIISGCGVEFKYQTYRVKEFLYNNPNIKIIHRLDGLLSRRQEFFSSMKSRGELGKIIEIANKEPNFERKAEKFLSLIRK